MQIYYPTFINKHLKATHNATRALASVFEQPPLVPLVSPESGDGVPPPTGEEHRAVMNELEYRTREVQALKYFYAMLEEHVRDANATVHKMTTANAALAYASDHAKAVEAKAREHADLMQSLLEHHLARADAAEAKTTCVQCRSAPRDVRFVTFYGFGCRHVCLCSTCATQMEHKACPVCATPFDGLDTVVL